MVPILIENWSLKVFFIRNGPYVSLFWDGLVLEALLLTSALGLLNFSTEWRLIGRPFQILTSEHKNYSWNFTYRKIYVSLYSEGYILALLKQVRESPQSTTNVEYKINHISKTKKKSGTKKFVSENCAPFGTKKIRYFWSVTKVKRFWRLWEFWVKNRP